jgi:hypothetical protein
MMIDTITLQIIRDIVTIFGVLAGFTYYVLNVRNSQRIQKMTLETRQAQLFMQIYNRWADREMTKMEYEFQEWQWNDYDDYVRKYESDVNSLSLRTTIGKYYEGIGVLVKRGLVDPTFVDDLMSTGILRYWEKFEPIVRETRARSDWPQRAEYQEYLYNQIKKVAESQHPETASH